LWGRIEEGAMPHFLVPRAVRTGEEVVLPPRESHHLRDVLRLQVGEVVRRLDIKGHRLEARIRSLSARAVRVRIERALSVEPDRGRLSLVQALLKGEKMEFVIQKSVELGVREIFPVSTIRSIHQDAQKKLARWRRIAEEAAKQCGRTPWTEVHELVPLSSFLASSTVVAGVQKILFWEGSEEKLRLEGESLLFLIGPEGGLASEEVEAATQSGFKTAGLGRGILRAETAAFAAATILQHELGNL
jgi:16S rRNA (uracil1498-N3)-methyltransferase